MFGPPSRVRESRSFPRSGDSRTQAELPVILQVQDQDRPETEDAHMQMAYNKLKDLTSSSHTLLSWNECLEAMTGACGCPGGRCPYWERHDPSYATPDQVKAACSNGPCTWGSQNTWAVYKDEWKHKATHSKPQKWSLFKSKGTNVVI